MPRVWPKDGPHEPYSSFTCRVRRTAESSTASAMEVPDAPADSRGTGISKTEPCRRCRSGRTGPHLGRLATHQRQPMAAHSGGRTDHSPGPPRPPPGGRRAHRPATRTQHLQPVTSKTERAPQNACRNDLNAPRTRISLCEKTRGNRPWHELTVNTQRCFRPNM